MQLSHLLFNEFPSNYNYLFFFPIATDVILTYRCYFNVLICEKCVQGRICLFDGVFFFKNRELQLFSNECFQKTCNFIGYYYMLIIYTFEYGKGTGRKTNTVSLRNYTLELCKLRLYIIRS